MFYAHYKKNKNRFAGEKCNEITTACSVNVTFVFEYLTDLTKISTPSVFRPHPCAPAEGGRRAVWVFFFFFPQHNRVTGLPAEYLSGKRGLIRHAKRTEVDFSSISALFFFFWKDFSYRLTSQLLRWTHKNASWIRHTARLSVDAKKCESYISALCWKTHQPFKAAAEVSFGERTQR